jgi:regulator of vacuolar morphogenesis
MEHQDTSVDELAKVVRKQREIGLAIQTEVTEQNEMLRGVEEDVDRVKKKVDIAGKRSKKIS